MSASGPLHLVDGRLARVSNGSSQGVARTAALEKRQEGRQLAHVVGWCVQTSDCLMRLGKVRPGWKETFQLLSRAIE